MKRPILLLLAVSVAGTFTCAQTRVKPKVVSAAKPAASAGLSVEDVVKLAKAGLSEDIIIQQIKKKGHAFDLSTDDLIALKSANVSDRIVQVMMDPSKADVAASSAAVTNTSASTSSAPASFDGAIPSETGVYVRKQGQWAELLPEVVYWKTGGVLKSIASAGIIKGDVNGHLAGPTSRNSLALPQEFLVVMPEGVAVTEYQLLRLRRTKENREFRTVTGGVLHTEGGATRDLILFESKKVAPRVFSITFPATAGPGEYGFLPPGSSGSSGKIFSFRIAE